jgi:16S rRNA (cytosine1402-N4)-methyltransferase
VVEFTHRSVLVRETIEQLAPRNGGVYCDCTIGGGGHTAALLDAAQVRVIGIDRDPAAIAATRARLGDRVELVHGELGDIVEILSRRGIERVDGFVVDLGVSSPQLDDPERGFSFQRPGPLDMRMDPSSGRTALELLRETDVETLATVLSELGEERHAKKLARAIREAVTNDQLHTTMDLATVVVREIPTREQRVSKIHPATRTFQALRIAVNRELDQLQQFLHAFPDLLAPGGRCVAISFHSLEDRLVKHAFRDLAWTSSLPPLHAERAGERAAPVVELLTRKPVIAGPEELAENPRARSAKLRACQRTAAPNVLAHASA